MMRLIEKVKVNDRIDRFIADNGAQLKKIAVVTVLIVVGLAVFAFSGTSDGTEIVSDDSRTEMDEPTDFIYVDIGGAVKTPMLAQLPRGSRVEDAIIAAGGLNEDAEMTSINRAEFLEDGEKIFIPSANASAETGNVPATEEERGIFDGKVNINTADSSTLQTLNGVGPATAQKIIDYRNEHGRFNRIEDLKNVSGIGEKTFEKLKDYISI